MRRIVFLAILTLSVVFGAHAQAPNTISTVAGGGTNPSTATNAYIPGPQGVVRDSLGNTFVSVAGLNIVYKVTSAGVLSVYAGNGIGGFSGDGGAATSAELNGPQGLALDANNNLFIADSASNRIRRVDASTGKISTYAGSGNQYNGTGFFGGYTGDNGPATSAQMNVPSGLAFDKIGNLFIADSGNNVIRMVDTSVQHIITTYAGNGTAGIGGTSNGDGGPATSAQLNLGGGAASLAVDANNNLFIPDSNDSVVRMVSGTGSHTISTYAGSITTIFTFSGDNGPANQAGLNFPTSVALDAAGDLFISDFSNNRIRKVDTTLSHIITTVAGSANLCLTFASCGDGGAATSAELNQPFTAFPDASGNLAIVDFGTNRIRVVTGTTISTFAGGGSGGDGGLGTAAVVALPFVVALDAQGNVFFEENTGNRIRRWDATTKTVSTYVGNGIATVPGAPNGDGGLATAATVVGPLGMLLDTTGNLYFADGPAHVVRKVDQATKHIATFAGTGAACNTNTNPGCGDGGPATSATFKRPWGVAIDSKGNVYISDSRLQRIRKVDTSLQISNFAGTGAICTWTAASPCGDGGAATSASFNFPQGLAVDAQDNLYIADALNNVIRKIDTNTGLISTVAFNGQPTFGGDGASAASASMQSPEQVAIDPVTGALFVGGGFDNVVRRIDTIDPSNSVITMAGDVHNLDGGFNGDGGPSTQALLANFGVAIDTNHNVYIGDAGNGRVRVVHIAPVVAATPSALTNFGAVLPGDTSAPQLITVTNGGLDDLTISNVQAPGGFTLLPVCVNGLTGLTAPPGGSCILDLSFAPAAGTGGTVFSGNVTFATNDSAHSLFTYTATGTSAALPGVGLNVTLAGTTTGATVSASPNGIVSGSPGSLICPTACSANFAPGEQVSLVGIGSAGNVVTGWNVNGSATICPVALTCVLTMPASGTTNVTATFGSTTVTVAGIGNGTGTITDNQIPPQISCTYNGTTTTGSCTGTYPLGTATVALTATPTGTSSFAGWLGFCSVAGIDNAGTGPCNLNLTVPIILSLTGSTATAVFSGPAKPFSSGQVFVGTVDGMIFVYNANGTLAQVLNSNTLGGAIAGMNFDSSGNLFAANFGANTVERFIGGTATPTSFGGPYNSAPIGLVIDPSNNVFVGQSSGDNTLLQFASGGTLTNTFFPAYDQGGIGYLELLDDGARVLYTSSTQSGTTAGSVRNYDIANNAQNPDFAINLPGGPAFAVRELSDKSVLVANATKITHLDPNGGVIASPSLTPPAGGLFFALNLDPSGTSFWTGDALTGKIYQVRIADGKVLNTINTGLGFNSNTIFTTVYGIAVFGQPQSGGADLRVNVSAPLTDAVNTPFTYQATVVNGGPLSAAGVTVTDTFPAGVTVNTATTSQGTCTVAQAPSCNIGTMISGATVTVNFNVTPTQTVTLGNTVTANATTPDPIPGNNSFTTSTVVSGSAQASISMSATSSLQLGNGMSYLIQVTNPGAVALSNLTVTDTLPGGLSAVSVSTNCSGTTTVTCTIFTLGAGQSASEEIVIIPTQTGSLSNTSTVTGGASASVTTNVINNGVPLLVELDSLNPLNFVTSSPAGVDCTTQTFFCVSYFPGSPATTVVLTANGPNFFGWLVDGVNGPAGCAGTGTCTLTTSAQHAVVAIYNTPPGFISTALPEGVVGVPYAVDLAQAVIAGAQPYTFTITGGLPGGLTLTSPDISGVPTTPGTTSFTMKATDTFSQTASANTSITVINPPNTQAAKMNGPYAVLFRGVSDADSSLRDFVGSLNFNGSGGITGTIDTNGNGTSPAPQTLTLTGTYTIGPDNRGLMFLNTAAGKFGTFAFSVGDVHVTSGQNIAFSGNFIRFDDNTGTGIRGAGIMRRQVPSSFNPTSFAGPYVYQGTGQTPTFGYAGEVGFFVVDALNNFSSGSADANLAGVVGTIPTISGTYGATSSTTGRTQWTLNVGSVVAYIIDPVNVFFMSFDPGASKLLLAGTAERQDPGPFSNASLAGPDIVSVQNPVGVFTSSNSQVFVGTLTSSPAGANPTNISINFDANNAGTLATEATEGATFTIAANGRGTFNLPTQVIVYMIRQDHGLMLGTGANASVGFLDFQHGGPFNNPSFAGNFFGGDWEPASPSGGAVVSGTVVVASGTTTLDSDNSHTRGTLNYGQVDIRGFSVDATGRIALPAGASTIFAGDVVGYLVSPSHFLVADSDPSSPHPSILEFESEAMPPGVASPAALTVNFPTPVQFPNSTASNPFTITNTGDGILTLTSLTNATDFRLTGSCTTPLPNIFIVAHGTCQLIVNFGPAQSTAGGPVSENLTLHTDAGDVTITATGTVTSSVTLQSIAVTPANPSVAKGLTQQFTATGTFSDNSTQNLTNQVTWASATPAVATITAGGLATGVTTGTSNISATLNAVSGSTVLTVTAPVLQSIAVTPANPSIAQGTAQQFTATGTFSDNSTQNLTAQVTWASATTSVATIVAGGLATGVSTGTSNISATLNAVSGSTVLTVTTPSSDVSITKQAPATIAVNGVLSYTIKITNNGPQTATGVGMSDPVPGGYMPGSVQPLLTNGVGCIASFNLNNNQWSVGCSFPTLANGVIQTVTYSITPTAAGTLMNTATVSSTSADPNQANNSASATTVVGGTPASFSAIVQGTAIGTVTDGNGGQINCQHTTQAPNSCSAIYATGSVITLTESTVGNFLGWLGSPNACTVVGNTCQFTMVAGETVTANFVPGATLLPLTVAPSGAQTGSGTLTSLPPVITNCRVTTTTTSGCTANFPVGELVNLTIQPDSGSQFVGWSGTTPTCLASSAVNCLVAMTAAENVFVQLTSTTLTFPLTVTDSGTGTGTVTSQAGLVPAINCTTGSATGCSGTYNANASVVLAAAPATGSAFAGWSGACTNATGTCTVTMTQAQNVTATFNPSGAPTLQSIAVTPANPTIAAFSTQQFTATGTFSDNSTQNLTASVTWSSSVPTVAQVSNAAGSQGLASSLISGSTSITATSGAVVGSTTLTVSGPLLVADWNVSGEGPDDKQRIDGKSPALQVGLKNSSSTQTLHVTGATADNPAFTVTTNCATLAPGQTCTVSASFTAAATCQSVIGIVTVASDDPAGNLLLEVDGRGADAGLQVADMTNAGVTALSLVQKLVGTGVTISNVKYTGAPRSAGTFNSSSNIIGFTDGVVLSSGSVRNVVGPNCSAQISADNGQPGDADLDGLLQTGQTTNDAAVLEFDFVPASPSISFQYVFSSDEYNEFVGQFNDVFGFFLGLKGSPLANIALIPGTNLPVSINNVNGGNPLGTNPVNAQFFVNNDFQPPLAAPVDTEMDGLTVVFTAQAQVVPGSTYHIKLAIADALDFALDSNVFIKAGSLTSSAVTLTPPSVAFGNQPVGQQSAATPVTLANTGTTAVNISSIVATPPFGETNACPAQLAPAGQQGSSCTINVTINPTSAISFTGNLTVTDDSPAANSTQIVTLSGTGTGTGPTLQTITVAPPTASIAVGATQAFTATGHFSDGTSGPTSVTWSSSSTGIATVNATTGVAKGISAGGPISITATSTLIADVNGSAQLTVTAPTLLSIAVTPANPTVVVGQTQQFTATGTYSDNSTKDLTSTVSWSSSNTDSASIPEGGGLATGLAPGNTTISATLGNVTGSTTLTVTSVPFILTITPPPGGNPGAPITVSPGGQLAIGLKLTATPGFSGTVTFSCISNAPQFLTCAPAPATVTLSGNQPKDVAIVMNTFCKGDVPIYGPGPGPGGLGGGLVLLLVVGMLGSITWAYRRGSRWALSFAVLMLIALGNAACSGGPASGPGGRTPAGNYTLFITATANGSSQTVQVPIQVTN